ncbi:MAG TPA: 3'-5' exonuclease [Scandinavium sp.]|jgi:DNA polymerase III epsilon subunit-like protein
MRDEDESGAHGKAVPAGDACFTRGRLRDEFRLKPAPGAEPVKWYKNPYGGKYGVWRVADCVPMQEKRPQSEKQRRTSKRLGLQARLNSQRGQCALLAATWLSRDPVFLDTETTGLDPRAQAVEIALVDAAGKTLYETRLRPTVSIDPAAAAVHGINNADLVNAPSWPEIMSPLKQHIGQRPLVIFNADFDRRILKQTAAAHDDPACWLDTLTVYCTMHLSAGFYGPTNRYGTISLASAVSQAGLCWSGQAHSAVADANMTARVVNHIAEYGRQLQRKIENATGNKPE